MSDRLSDVAVERIVRRAIELDAAGEDRVGALDSAAVIAAATELGISRDSVLAALAAEQLGPEPEPRRLDPVFGARWVVAQRTVLADAGDTFDRLDDWLSRGHHLRRDERQGFSGVWRRRDDVAASVQRGVRGISGGARLGSVASIIGHCAPVDATRSIVRVVADRTASRSTSIGATGVFGASGIAAGLGLATVAPPLAVFGAPGVVVAGAVAVGSKRASNALQWELVRLLDQLDSGLAPGPPVAIRLPRRSRRSHAPDR